MRVSRALRTRLAVATLSLALLYAFTCSGACALCMGARAAAATEIQGCGHGAADAGSGSRQQGPAKPDCFEHHHSSFEVLPSDGLSQFQLSATGYAAQLFHGALRADVVKMGVSFFSNLAPPLDGTISPQRKISILRI